MERRGPPPEVLIVEEREREKRINGHGSVIRSSKVSQDITIEISV
jgi:hypothetical protein